MEPSNVKAGEAVDLTIEAVDKNDNVVKDSNWDQSNTLPDLEKELLDIASECEKEVVNYGERPWDSHELKFLRA